MNNKKTYIILFFILFSMRMSAQNTNDTTQNKTISLDEVVISANKTEETKKTVAQQVQVLKAKEIENTQSQSTADLIMSTGNVFVQKSQLGGGSPVIRGFEASRILLVIDGVRMNNLIYRAGHLQNIVTTDNNSLDRVEILYGPSSTIYGSDALGGVIHLYTKKPLLATGDKNLNLKVNAFSRYGSVDNEATGHLDFNIGLKKFASFTSFTYSKFDDLMSGMNQNPFYTQHYGERFYYAQRFNETDSVVRNGNRYRQVQSGYSQYDVVQKFLFQQNDHLSHGLNVQYSNSTDVPRYDRLTDNPTGGLADIAALNSAEWYYGPQERLLAAYDGNFKNEASLFQNVHLGLNYQKIEESRHNRNFGSRFLTHRVENVDVIGANLDFQKTIKSHDIRFGLDAQLNMLTSTATRENIVVDTSANWDTRYPDGDNTMNNYAFYISHTWKINEQLTLNDGFRVGYSSLHSTLVDTALLFHLPYTTLDQKTPVYSGSIGLIHSPTDDLKLSALFSTGFRVPNVDDLAKVFVPPSGGVIVPNVDLKPEKTINYEIGIAKIFNSKTRWENAVYYTTFIDVAVVDEFKYNGQDSILYDGTLSQVYANQNKNKAYMYGVSSNLISQTSEHFMLKFGINYTYGRVKTDTSDAPLDHIPPFMSQLAFTYINNNFSSDFIINYNGWKKMKDYGGGEDNPQYATPDGIPAWLTANFHVSYKVHKLVTLQGGIDNIFDTQYRTFASGINAPGRNVFGAIRFHY
ncbi:MAG TPA: TonB-dependent receptor [Bacteroidia bacterium]|nr:TonB-dependent receptor [Bacteroidia bacterium]